MVGRKAELVCIEAALERCRAGAGGIVLVAGEAGVGKSRLVAECLAGWESRVLRGAAAAGCQSYEPLSDALRVLHEEVDDSEAHRQVELLPESRPSAGDRDRIVHVDWMRQAFRRLVEKEPAVVVLEDLHSADAATLEILPPLAAVGEHEPMLIVATYRSDQLSRRHPLRRTRAELRRTGALTEVVLDPLSRDETRELLTGLLGAPVSLDLLTAVDRRAEGLPFFVEEMAAGLEDAGALREADGMVELAEDVDLAPPESVTDAVLARTADLRRTAGEAVELAAVLGVRVHLPTLAGLVSSEAVDELLEAGLLLEEFPGAPGADVAVFRHALVQEVLHRAIPWGRRRRQHVRVATCLAEQGAAPEAVAEHWIAAHEPSRARPLLLAAAQRSCSLHAYRDAARLVRRALESWPEQTDPEGRIDALERLAGCAELCGEHQAAADAWAAAAGLRAKAGDVAGVAAANRRRATALEMVGDVSGAMAAREAAAAGFASAGDRGEAVEERILLADHLWSAGQNTRALEHAVAATEDAELLDRPDLRARALAVQGGIRAAMGEGARGVEMARDGLALAMDSQLHEPAGEAYYQLAAAMLYATDYKSAADAYGSAFELCHRHAITDLAQACSACLAVVLRLAGDWDRALSTAAEVLAAEQTPDNVRMVALEELGLISSLRGDARRARGPLRRAVAFGRQQEIFGIEVGAMWGLAVVAELDGDTGAASDAVSTLLDRCAGNEERHFALPALRWGSTFLAEHGGAERGAQCHRLLATAATRDSSPKVLSALAHAGGELAWAEGDPAEAAGQFRRAVDLLHGITAPYEAALSQLRWGAALAASGEQEGAADTVTDAYHRARRLGARPLARSCATRLAVMGEPVSRRLGRIAARSLEPAGLTRREKQVLRLLSDGLTNRQIAVELVLSTRTVDMHVRSLFTKLGCTSRLGAARRGVELGIVDATAPLKVRQ